MEDVTFEGFNVVWTCPCSDWSSVDKYNLNLIASDGEIDYTHISRTDGKCLNLTQNVLVKKECRFRFPCSNSFRLQKCGVCHKAEIMYAIFS